MRAFPALHDLAILLARVVIGVVFIAHGWQKFSEWGIEGTTQSFDGMGIPMPEIAAPAVAAIEVGAGALLVVGLLTPLAGVLLAAVMVGATAFVHWDNGVFVGDGGWELVAALGVGALLLAAVGAGRFSLDALLGGRRRRRA